MTKLKYITYVKGRTHCPYRVVVKGRFIGYFPSEEIAIQRRDENMDAPIMLGKIVTDIPEDASQELIDAQSLVLGAKSFLESLEYVAKPDAWEIEHRMFDREWRALFLTPREEYMEELRARQEALAFAVNELELIKKEFLLKEIMLTEDKKFRDEESYKLEMKKTVAKLKRLNKELKKVGSI